MPSVDSIKGSPSRTPRSRRRVRTPRKPVAVRRERVAAPMTVRHARLILWSAVTVTMLIIVVGWVQVQRSHLAAATGRTVNDSELTRLRDEFTNSLERVRNYFTGGTDTTQYPKEVQELQDTVFPQFDTNRSQR